MLRWSFFTRRSTAVLPTPDTSVFEDAIPDELLALILSFLVPSSPSSDDAALSRSSTPAYQYRRLIVAAAQNLSNASRVNHRWHRVSSDPSIWWLLIRPLTRTPEVSALIEQMLMQHQHMDYHSHNNDGDDNDDLDRDASQALQRSRYSRELSAHELLAPKRIAATIIMAKNNMYASRCKRDAISFHIFPVSHSIATGCWIATSNEFELCVWQLVPHAPRSSRTSNRAPSASNNNNNNESTSTSSASTSTLTASTSSDALDTSAASASSATTAASTSASSSSTNKKENRSRLRLRFVLSPLGTPRYSFSAINQDGVVAIGYANPHTSTPTHTGTCHTATVDSHAISIQFKLEDCVRRCGQRINDPSAPKHAREPRESSDLAGLHRQLEQRH